MDRIQFLLKKEDTIALILSNCVFNVGMTGLVFFKIKIIITIYFSLIYKIKFT